MDATAILEEMRTRSAGTLIDSLGIEITGIDGPTVLGRMPVDKRTIQFTGILHGGASAAFAETLGSIGGNLQVNYPSHYCLGVDLNTHYLKQARGGWVYGAASPVKTGTRIQVWDILITNEKNEPVCVSRLTLAVVVEKE